MLNISILFIRVHNIFQSKPISDILSKYDDCVHFSDLKALETPWPPPTIQNVLSPKDSNFDIEVINIKTFWIVDGGKG